MSVLAGVIHQGSENPASRCSRILLHQGSLGREPHQLQRLGWGEFGVSNGASVAVSGPYLLATDARIDQDDRIWAQLAGLPRRHGRSEAEILLAAWRKSQSAVLDHIVGDYALAVYDRDAQTVTLARDPTGQRPLFYKVQGSAIAFASLPSGLKDVFTPSDFNLSLLALNLEGTSTEGDESHWTGLKRVQPGEIVEFSNGSIRRRFHWEPEIDGIPEQSSEDYVSSYRVLLDSAVRSSVHSRSHPIGSQLSSGLDSNAVTATAARMIDPKTDLIAFTAAPHAEFDDQLIRHRFADESAFAAETARMHGIKHIIVRETQPIFDIVKQEIRHLQAPVLDPFNMAWWAQIRYEASQAGVRTLLTGEIGNLTLNGGGLYMMAAFIKRGAWATWFREAMKFSSQPNVRWRGILMNSFGYRLSQATRNRLQGLFLGIPDPKHQSFVRREWRKLVCKEDRSIQSNNPYQGMLDNIRQMDFGLQRKAALAGYGIDELDPLSDRRILDFALRLPPEQMLRDGKTRALARTALKDRVPPSILNLKTRGLQSADWHLRISQQTARDIFEDISSDTNVQNLLDLGKIDRTIQNWPATDLNSYANIVTYRNQLAGALSIGVFLSENGAGA